MRILLAGPEERTAGWTQAVAAELFALGHEVRVFDYRNREKRLRRLGSRSIGRWRMNRLLVRTVERQRPELLLVLKGECIWHSALSRVSSNGVKTANWFPDDPHLFALSRRLAPRYDYYFTHCTYAVERLRKEAGANAFYLPLACHPLFFERLALNEHDRSRYGSDVVFVGAYDEARDEVLSALTDFDLKIWGPNWRRSRLLRFWVGRGAYGRELATVLSSARIVMNVHKNFGRAFEGYGHAANVRIFETTACGAFLLCDRKKDVEAIFEEGTEAAYYETPEEAREKVAYYLEHEEETTCAAARARARTLREHSLRSRLAQLITTVNAGPGKDESS